MAKYTQEKKDQQAAHEHWRRSLCPLVIALQMIMIGMAFHMWPWKATLVLDAKRCIPLDTVFPHFDNYNEKSSEL